MPCRSLKKTKKWRPRGLVVWKDLDYPDGVLIILVKIKDEHLLHDPEPRHHSEIFWLAGEARSFRGRYMGTFIAEVDLADGAYMNPPAEPGSRSNWVGLTLRDRSTGEIFYYTFHPRHAKGDIRCSWEPEYSST